MKKLYEVTKHYYIMAWNEDEAAFYNIGFEGEVEGEACEANSVDSEWWGKIPFNSDDDRTCGQILVEAQADPS